MREWRELTMQERYEQVYGSPRSTDAPAAAVPPLSGVLRGGELSEDARRNVARVDARRALDNALRAEAEQAERERQAFRRDVMHNTELGRLLRR